MKHLLILYFIILTCPYIKAQDTLFTKSVLGAGNRNLFVSNPVYTNNKIVFFTSNYWDSLATPMIKMVVLDTCGNVEKTYNVPLDGYRGLQLSSYYFISESLSLTSDGHFILIGNQQVNSKIGFQKFHCLKIDINGNILKKWVIETRDRRFEPLRIFETESAFYCSGLSFEVDALPPFFYEGFLLKIDKQLGVVWNYYPGLATDFAKNNDTLAIIGDGKMTKIYDDDKKTKTYSNNSFQQYPLSKFVNNLNGISFAEVSNSDSLGNFKSKVIFVQTDNNFKTTSEKTILTAALEEVPIYLLLDKKNKRFLLNTNNSKTNLILNELDLSGNMVWSRVDSIKHKDIVKFKYLYDYYSGFVVLPSKNIIGFILSSIYSSELPYNEWLNEIRVVKFDKNGKAVLKDCSITSIIDFPTDLQVLIAPNPFSTETNITISNDSYRDEYLISVCDITGRLIDEYRFMGNSFTLKRASLLAGVYLCTIKNIENNKMITKKIVIS